MPCNTYFLQVTSNVCRKYQTDETPMSLQIHIKDHCMWKPAQNNKMENDSTEFLGGSRERKAQFKKINTTGKSQIEQSYKPQDKKYDYD